MTLTASVLSELSERALFSLVSFMLCKFGKLWQAFPFGSWSSGSRLGDSVGFECDKGLNL